MRKHYGGYPMSGGATWDKLPSKNAKYYAQKTVIDGITFDSKKEAQKYLDLKLLQRAGEVIEIELQPEFVLQEAYRYKGKKVRAVTYRADFRVRYRDGREVVIDTKGYRTKEYLIKRKLLLARYPDIDFVEE